MSLGGFFRYKKSLNIKSVVFKVPYFKKLHCGKLNQNSEYKKKLLVYFDKLHVIHVCKLSAKRTIPDASVKGESLTKKRGGGYV